MIHNHSEAHLLIIISTAAVEQEESVDDDGIDLVVIRPLLYGCACQCALWTITGGMHCMARAERRVSARGQMMRCIILVCNAYYMHILHFLISHIYCFYFFLTFLHGATCICYVLYIWYCMVGMTSECIRPFVKGIKYRMDVAQHRIKYNRSSLCAWCTSLSRPYAILYYFLSCCCCYSSLV